MPSKAKNQQAQIEQAVGESVTRLQIPIDQLLKSGVLVDLRIGRWRATTTLSLADLGVRFETDKAKDAASRVLKPGQRLLMPGPYIRKADSIESCIRTTLSQDYARTHQARAYAYKTRWGAFVPASSFADWKAVFQSLKDKYMALRDQICDEYESWRTEITNDYLEIAGDTRARMVKARIDCPPWEEMKQATLAWLNRNLPTPDRIRDSFICEYELSFVPTPATLAAETEHLIVAGLNDEKVAAIRAMNAEVVAQERAARERVITEFEQNVRGQLYGLVHEAVTSLVRMVDRADTAGSDGIGKRASAKIAFIRDQVRSLDLFEDQELAAELAKLEGKVTSTPADMANAAKEFKAYVKAQLESLELDLPRARQEIAAAPVVELGTRRARQPMAAAATAEAPDLSLRRVRSL